MTRTRQLALVLIALLGATSLLGAGPAAAAKKPRAKAPKAFRSCDALLRHVRARALDVVGPYGLPVRFGVTPAMPPPRPMPMPTDGSGPGAERRPATTEAPVPAAPGAADPSTTNVQEAGVDEPDLVKTEGHRLYAVAGGRLNIVDIGASGPRLLGTLALEGWGHELLVDGGKLLVLANGATPVEVRPLPRPAEAGAPDSAPATSMIAPAPSTATATLTEVDVSNGAAPRVLRSLTVDGAYVSARRHGRTARVVVSSPPEPLPVKPLPAGEPVTDQTLRAQQHAAAQRAPLSTWRPTAVLRRGGKVTRRPLVPCRAVRRLSTFSGLGTLTVLTIDLAKGLPAVDADALLTDAQTVYASDRSLYVATERWVDPADAGEAQPAGRATTIHRFDVTDPHATTYRSTGLVRGFLLNQFSLSEDQSVLRVATTEQPAWWGPGTPQRASESFVTVLGERDGALAELGRVGGLGHGERIFAVRFLGDVGYVVTFRQTDPLYTVDLSTPSAPRVVGELKIPGYSAYLHPAGDGLLLGVGRDATEEGRVQGVQVSLFDVSDPRAPRRLAQRTLGRDTSSEVEQDHHAFLFWPGTGLTVIPVQSFGTHGMVGAAAAFKVAGRDLAEAGRIVHEGDAAVRRALVAGGRVFTVSDGGVAANRLDGLEPAGWAKFPGP